MHWPPKTATSWWRSWTLPITPAIDALAAKYVETPIDLLLNNAGIGGGIQNQLFGKMNYETFDQVMDDECQRPDENVRGIPQACAEQ